MNPSNYLLLKGGVNAVQGGTKGLTSSDKKKAADVGKGGNDENDEKQALLQRQRMLNRREPTGDAFTDYIQPTTAEFFGALLLIYVVVVSQLSPSAVVRGAAHGLTLGALMLCFLDISVGCFNPALTIAILIAGCGADDDFRLLNWRLALCLIGAQMLAGLIGAVLARGTLSYIVSTNNVASNNVSANNVTSNNASANNVSSSTTTAFEMAKGGVPYLSPGVGGFQGFLCETLLTCLLTTVLLMTLVEAAPFSEKPLSAIAVGMVTTAATSATVDVTGGVLNPARSLGPALVGCDLPSTQFADQLVYVVAPLLGAAIAALLYRSVFASTDKRMFFTDDDKKKKKQPASATANSASKPSE